MKKLINDRIKNFIGHGNLKSDLWFIGMEEGYDGTMNGLLKRFSRTKGKKVIDPRPSERWFIESSNIQHTWGKLIRILLAMKHPKKIAMDKEQVRMFQIKRFGKRNGDHAMLDLMPLPCGSVSKWIYANLGIPHLDSRKAYEREYRPKRIELFGKEIAKYQPKAVVLCSFSHRHSVWPDIAGGSFGKIPINDSEIYHRKDGRTDYFVVPHPAARQPLGNEYWFKVGRLIQRTISS